MPNELREMNTYLWTALPAVNRELSLMLDRPIKIDIDRRANRKGRATYAFRFKRETADGKTRFRTLPKTADGFLAEEMHHIMSSLPGLLEGLGIASRTTK